MDVQPPRGRVRTTLPSADISVSSRLAMLAVVAYLVPGASSTRVPSRGSAVASSVLVISPAPSMAARAAASARSIHGSGSSVTPDSVEQLLEQRALLTTDVGAGSDQHGADVLARHREHRAPHGEHPHQGAVVVQLTLDVVDGGPGRAGERGEERGGRIGAVQAHDGARGIDDVAGSLGERVPDAESGAALVDGDAAHGLSVSSPTHGIAAGPAGLDPDVTSIQTVPRARTSHVGLAILALALGGFAIGTTEFVTMGLLPDIARGIDESIPTTGHIISAYAFGVVVGAPVIVSLAARLPRRELAIGLVLALGLGNALTALAHGYWEVMAARFLSGLPHGAYFGVASLIAASLVAPERRGRAVSGVMLGLTVATRRRAFRRAPGWGSSSAGAAPTGPCSASPSSPPRWCCWSCRTSRATRSATVRAELTALRRPQVLYAVAAGMVGFGGLFAMYSYINPIVTDVTDLSAGCRARLPARVRRRLGRRHLAGRPARRLERGAGGPHRLRHDDRHPRALLPDGRDWSFRPSSWCSWSAASAPCWPSTCRSGSCTRPATPRCSVPPSTTRP